MNAIAYVEIRSQHAVGTWPRQGPDTYVAVQIVPEGVDPLIYLNKKVAANRGIEIEYFGEGYRSHRGPNSALGEAIRTAEERAAEINAPNLATA